MPRPLRLTMFFDDGGTGWSESHYDTRSASLTAAITLFKASLLKARINLMACGPWLKYVRASYDDTFRDAQVYFIPEPSTGGIGGSYLNNPAWANDFAGEEWTAVLARGISGDLYRKQIYLSGTPFRDQADVFSPFHDAEIVKAFLAYKNSLVNNSYGFPVWQRDVQTYPFKQITAITPQAGAPPNFTIPNHNFPGGLGTRVYLSQIRYLYQLPPPRGLRLTGPFPYTVIDANTISVPSFVTPIGGQFVSGQAQNQLKGVVPYDDVIMERFTHRKRGRPFDAPRGRSRRRTCPQVVVK